MARRRERSRLHLRPEAAEKLREHLWPVQTPSLPPLYSPIFSLKRQQLASNNCELRSWGCIATHGHITSGSAGREGMMEVSKARRLWHCVVRARAGDITGALWLYYLRRQRPETRFVSALPQPRTHDRRYRGCLAMLEVLAAPPSSPTNSCRSSRLAIQRRTALSVLSSNLPSRCTKGEEGEVGGAEGEKVPPRAAISKEAVTGQIAQL